MKTNIKPQETINCGDEVKYQKATKDLVPDILALENSCFSYAQFSERQFKYLITKAKGEFHVAILNGKIVGYVSFLTNRLTHNVRVYSLAVDSNARGKHIGQHLMQIPLDYMKVNNMRKASLEVKTTNEIAICLYEKLGYKITKQHNAYYDDGSDAYIMVVNNDNFTNND